MERTGIVYGMSAEEYHAGPEVSATGLKEFAQSPRHYWSWYINPDRPKRKVTPAMLAGTLAHCTVLEPDHVSARYVIKPEGHDGRTKAGKAWLESLDGTQTVISAEMAEAALAQKLAIAAVPELLQAMSSGAPEVSIFWPDEETDLWCRARPDWLHLLPDGRAIVVDLKTTSDISDEGFSRSVSTYGYHRQQAHYVAGLAACGIEVAAFLFGAVTTEYPFIARPILLDDDAQRRGEEERRALLRRFKRCQDANDWPAFKAGVQVVSLPAWSKPLNTLESET